MEHHYVELSAARSARAAVGGMELEIESGAYPEPYRPAAPRVDPSGVV